jgi:hypothetical protein
MLATGQATLKQMLESKAYSQPVRARLSFVSPHLDGREDHLPKPLGMQLLDGHRRPMEEVPYQLAAYSSLKQLTPVA